MRTKTLLSLSGMFDAARTVYRKMGRAPNTAAGPAPAPPPATFYITTRAGDILATRAADQITYR